MGFVPSNRAGFHDDAGVGAVMIASAEQRSARGRAKRRGVEIVVAQARVRQPVHRYRRNRSAEGGRGTEAYVIGEDNEDIRRSLGCFDHLWEVLYGLLCRAANLAAEGLFGPGQDFLRPCCGHEYHAQRKAEGGDGEILSIFGFQSCVLSVVDWSVQIDVILRFTLRASPQLTLIARTSAARSSTGITGSSPLLLTGRLRR